MVIGPGDDAAVLPDHTVITVDTLVEGVHFDGRLTMEDVGYKAVAVSVSDIAAMGGCPTWMVLSISMPSGFTDREALIYGISNATQRFGVSLIGGDTTRSPGPLMISVTMAGHAPTPITRAGAEPGQDIWVTGFPGLASAGYLYDTPPDAALAALRRPVPPVELAQRLAQHGIAAAMMDLSDGVATDLKRLAKRSGVGISLRAAAFPRHPGLADYDAVQLALTGGDDYQLVFTAQPQHADHIVSLAHEFGVVLTRIGSVTQSLDCVVDDRDWPSAAFEHFPEVS
ncbi:MAG: thiamine-monophosphate kinase [bacterium]|jgi:thiamine-monophosphate kinase